MDGSGRFHWIPTTRWTFSNDSNDVYTYTNTYATLSGLDKSTTCLTCGQDLVPVTIFSNYVFGNSSSPLCFAWLCFTQITTIHSMETMSRNNDKDEASDFVTGTRDENAPRSGSPRNRRVAILIVTIIAVLAILGITLGILLPNKDSTKESSRSIGDSSSSSAQNSSLTDEAPTIAPISSPTTAPSLVVPLPSPSPTALTKQTALPSASVTRAPTASPSAAPQTASPSRAVPPTPSPVNPDPTIQACLDQYQCQPDHPDRFGPETPLMIGDGLCNDNMRLGITTSGVFQFQNCDTQETKIMFEDTTGSVAYFSMSSIGTFRLMDQSDNIIWQRECSLTITFTQQCRSNPDLPCPYL